MAILEIDRMIEERMTDLGLNVSAFEARLGFKDLTEGGRQIEDLRDGDFKERTS